MRAARAALLLAVGLAALAAPRAAGAAEPGEGDRIGRYRVTPADDGIEIAAPRDRAVGLPLAGGGAVLAALGVGLLSAGRRGGGGALLLLGLALAALGGFGAFGAPRVRASRAELVREGVLGRVERWPRDALAGVEVARRAASAEDFKRAGAQPWDVRVRGRDGALLPVRFALRSEADARALGRALAEALGLPSAGR